MKANEFLVFCHVVSGVRASRRAGALTNELIDEALDELRVMHDNTDWPAMRAMTARAMGRVNRMRREAA